MRLQDINPYVRYAALQPSIFLGSVTRAAYDHRLFYCLSGVGSVTVREREYEVREDTAVFLQPGVPYKFTGNLKVMVLNFDLTRARQDITEGRKPSRIKDFDERDIIESTSVDSLGEYIVARRAYEVKETFHKCISLFKTDTGYKDAYSSSAVKGILSLLALALENERPAELVSEVMMYIQASFDTDITNESIATAFGYHSYYLNRIFKERTGKTLHKALTEVRVENARQLLKKTELPIREVQIRSGFGSRSQFNIAFEKETGMTPREYRRQSHSSS